MLESAFTLKEIGLFFVFLGLIVLIIYMIFFVKNLTVVLKSTNSILKDTKVITDIAQKRAKDADEMMDDVFSSVRGINNALKGNEGTVQSVASVGKAVSSLIGMLKDREKK